MARMLDAPAVMAPEGAEIQDTLLGALLNASRSIVPPRILELWKRCVLLVSFSQRLLDAAAATDTVGCLSILTLVDCVTLLKQTPLVCLACRETLKVSGHVRP